MPEVFNIPALNEPATVAMKETHCIGGCGRGWFDVDGHWVQFVTGAKLDSVWECDECSSKHADEILLKAED